MPSPEQLVSWLKLHELARFDLSTGYVERAAEALGREVAEDEKLVVEPPEADEPLAPTLYLAMVPSGSAFATRAVGSDSRRGVPTCSLKSRLNEILIEY